MNEIEDQPSFVLNKEDGHKNDNAVPSRINEWLPKCNSSYLRHRCWKAASPTCIWKLQQKENSESLTINV